MQRKFVSAGCHTHSNTHKPPKTAASTVLMLEQKFLLKCIGLINTYRLTQKQNLISFCCLHISISLWSLKLSNGYLIVEVLDYSVLPCFLFNTFKYVGYTCSGTNLYRKPVLALIFIPVLAPCRFWHGFITRSRFWRAFLYRKSILARIFIPEDEF